MPDKSYAPGFKEIKQLWRQKAAPWYFTPQANRGVPLLVTANMQMASEKPLFNIAGSNSMEAPDK